MPQRNTHPGIWQECELLKFLWPPSRSTNPSPTNYEVRWAVAMASRRTDMSRTATTDDAPGAADHEVVIPVQRTADQQRHLHSDKGRSPNEQEVRARHGVMTGLDLRPLTPR